MTHMAGESPGSELNAGREGDGAAGAWVGVVCRCKETILTCTLLDGFVGRIFTIFLTPKGGKSACPVSRLRECWGAFCLGRKVGEKRGKEEQ